ncbi:MAG: hypothetical protein E7513_03210 [Ruminococcaceae bacterium]|nr:hypothetical protein [Oscillospiraceae bacterium]
MKEKRYKTLEFIGIPIIYLIATLLHFVYKLSDGSTLSILFGAVNESVWEHIKIFSVGFVFWSVIILLSSKPPFYKFVVAKTVSLYFLSLCITVFFYTYTFFTKRPIHIVDLLSAVAFVALTQYISYRLVTSSNRIEEYFVVAVMLLMLFFVMFFSFTVFPPRADLFKDPVTGMYGIISENIDKGALHLHNSQQNP